MIDRTTHPWRDALTATKSFGHPVVGSYGLNRAGLHLWRMATTDVVFHTRRLLAGAPLSDELTRDGVAVLPDFAAPVVFEGMQHEVRAALADAARRVPHPPSKTRGFGPKMLFEGGFDRHDGGALNRFLDLGSPLLPLTREFVHESLAPFGARAVGAVTQPQKYMLQELVHFSNDADIQKVTHRDTFQPALKLWYFLEEVREEDGPFVYVRGSHRLSQRRARWEYQRSVEASRPDARDRSGSFRVTDEALLAMGYALPESFPVKANTLLIANVRGFHKRGAVTQPRARRVAIHASLRPSPFVPVPL